MVVKGTFHANGVLTIPAGVLVQKLLFVDTSGFGVPYGLFVGSGLLGDDHVAKVVLNSGEREVVDVSSAAIVDFSQSLDLHLSAFSDWGGGIDVYAICTDLAG